MAGPEPVVVRVDPPRIEGTITLEDIAARLEAVRWAGAGNAQSEPHPHSKVVALAKHQATGLARLHRTARPDRRTP